MQPLQKSMVAPASANSPGMGWAQCCSHILSVRSTAIVGIVTFLWLFATTGLYPLLLPDEGRYVGVAWNMLSAGQYSVPRLDGMPFFHKPPLFYWLTALSLHVLGINEWAARLSSVLSATLAATLMFWFLKNHVSQRVASVAVVILATQPLFFGAAHYANLDMTVAGLIVATVLVAAVAAFKYESQEPYRVVLALAYALAAAGFLAKGLIGIVIPGGIIFFWLLLRRRFGTMWHMVSVLGVAVFLLLSLPWMLYMQQRYPGFFDYYIVYQHFRRFAETGFNNAQPIWFYMPVLLGLTLPWSIHLWRLANKAWWRNSEHAAVRSLMLTWLLVVVVFFSLPSSKLVGYVLPALVPLAYFIAELLVAKMQGAQSVRAFKTFWWSAAISVAICMAAVAVMVARPQPSSKGLAAKLQPYLKPTDNIVMLGRYYYDLDFYLHSGKTAFVMLNWDDPGIKQADNWSRELYDAGLFEPKTAAQLLITPAELIKKMCGARAEDLWLVGQAGSTDDYAFLRGMAPQVQDGKLRAWHVPAGPSLSFCGETPKSAPK
ncbi:glycosyltransferase family 39 protein [Alcaligenaceae bacterium]|nr:glycosyltransferase family 39 protein [Alcaligenaceae bacterium]